MKDSGFRSYWQEREQELAGGYSIARIQRTLTQGNYGEEQFFQGERRRVTLANMNKKRSKRWAVVIPFQGHEDQ